MMMMINDSSFFFPLKLLIAGSFHLNVLFVSCRLCSSGRAVIFGSRGGVRDCSSRWKICLPSCQLYSVDKRMWREISPPFNVNLQEWCLYCYYNHRAFNDAHNFMAMCQKLALILFRWDSNSLLYAFNSKGVQLLYGLYTQCGLQLRHNTHAKGLWVLLKGPARLRFKFMTIILILGVFLGGK